MNNLPALTDGSLSDYLNEIKKFPINIIRCEDCTLLQIDYVVNQNEVYHMDYPYLPGITLKVD